MFAALGAVIALTVGGAGPDHGAEYLARVARLATVEAGVPLEWAESPALWMILKHESGLRLWAQNPRSSAFGLFQFLDVTWEQVGCERRPRDALRQFVCGYRYLRARYGTPERAWSFWQLNGWY